MKRVRLIINPSSGQEQAKEYAELAEEKLRSMFDRVDIQYTEKEDDATRFADEAARIGYDAVFAMGGDGTVDEVINGLAEHEVRPLFGFFPLGTVNDLGRALDLPLDPKKAIECISFDQIKPLDIGKINDRYFMDVVAIGTIPESINDVDPESKTKLGKFAYIFSGLKQLIKNESYDFLLKFDQTEVETTSSLILIGLTNSIGGFEQLLPKAQVDDGQFHLLYLKDQSMLDVIKSIPELYQGVETSSENVGYHTFKKGTIELTTATHLETNVDGDPGPALPVTLEIYPQHLQVFCGSEDQKVEK